jgi:dUTP pyrophosphatase
MVKKGELYLHFKGGLYKVVDFVTDCDSLKEKVVYQQMYDKEDFKKGNLWVRDLDDFEGFKETPTGKIKRFERIGQLVQESEKIKVQVMKLKEGAVIPAYGREGDAAMDMYSCENYIVPAGKRQLVSTGIAMSLPEGYWANLRGRSGLAYKQGVSILGGVIDHTYRGEYGVVFYNTGDEDIEIKKGDRVAQVIIAPVATAETEEVVELGESVRGEGGFGSSGR